jgi:UDPglucose 6-dehydrogenase
MNAESVTAQPRVTVIGTGYLGATHAVCLAILGFEVLGLDVDAAKVDALNAGVLPFHEPGLPELLGAALESGRLRFVTSFEEAGAFGDVHFVCVGTPQQAGSYAADLKYVDGAVESLAPYLTRPCLVVGTSTVPVGTAARLARLVRDLAPAGGEVDLAWNPEFLREGFAVEDSLHPDRLVFGVSNARSEAVLRTIYATPIADETPVVVTDLPTAELVKVAANSFLATKISFINAMAEVCEATGADVELLAKALSHDDRIGGKFLKPGLGFGGGCLPKDIRAFMARAGELGVSQALDFLREIDGINLRRRTRIIDLAREVAGGRLEGLRVAVLGAAFKPNSDDIRDSPALDVAVGLRSTGADVVVYDPQALANARRAYPNLTYGDSAATTLAGADVVLLLTEWDEFRKLDPVHTAALVRRAVIVDGRNVLDREAWMAAGWVYRALGRPSVPGSAAESVLTPASADSGALVEALRGVE